MLKSYSYKSYLLFATHNCIGFLLSLLLYFIFDFNKINDISSLLDIIIFLLIVIIFSVQVTNSFLIYIPSTKLNILKDGIQVIEFYKKNNFLDWTRILIIDLKIENGNLLNLYIILNDGKEYRHILKKK